MRVTGNMVSRNYLRGLQNNYAELNKYSQQVTTGRRYNKISEDASSGVRALQVRRKLQQIPAYIDNAKSVASKFSAGEKCLTQLSDLNQSVAELFIQGISDTCGAQQRETIALQIEKLRDEMLTLANSKYSSEYIFGGTNADASPFSVQGTPPELYYNGQAVSGLSTLDTLYNDQALVDLGLGLEKDPNDPYAGVKDTSVFKASLVGLEFMGTGDNNLYKIMTDMIETLRQNVPDKALAGDQLNLLRSATDHANLMVTRLGADSQYLEFTVDRLETEELNLKERQQNLEFIEPEEAIIYWQMQEFVYNAALQMGQRLLQPTLFDFIS